MADPQKDSPADLDFSPEAPLPEEESPYDAAGEDRPLLFVQIVDRSFSPQSGVAFQITGDGLPDVRQGQTNESGELLIEDCGPGVYTLTVDDRSCFIHTLSRRDLELEERAYRVML
jgi:hypothetical protein